MGLIATLVGGIGIFAPRLLIQRVGVLGVGVVECDLADQRRQFDVATAVHLAVGKSRLEERFISDHWLRGYQPPPNTPSGDAVVRLALPRGR